MAQKEQKDNHRPELAAKVDSLADYEVIFLGFPNWWGTMPMALFTFLEQYDFSGKIIIPFCTHEGSRLGRSVDDITRLAPRATILAGFEIRGSRTGSARPALSEWLEHLDFRK